MGRETMATLPSRPGVGTLEVAPETDLRRFLHGAARRGPGRAKARAASLSHPVDQGVLQAVGPQHGSRHG